MPSKRVIKAICCIFCFLLASCSREGSISDPSPTSTTQPTPTHTPTPAPSLDVLEWHLLFSGDQQTKIIRCLLLPDNSVMQPLQVTLRGTFISRQVIDEALVILERANPQAVVLTNRKLDNPNYAYVLIEVNLDRYEDDLLTPVELAPVFYRGELYQPAQIFFLTGNARPVRLHTLNTDFHPLDQSLPSELTPGVIYAIPFGLEGQDLQELQTMGSVHLEIALQMFGPFRRENCESGNTAIYSLNFHVATGDSRLMPVVYGEAAQKLPNEIITRMRWQLLTEVLLRDYASPSPIPEEAESDVDMTATPTPEIEDTPVSLTPTTSGN